MTSTTATDGPSTTLRSTLGWTGAVAALWLSLALARDGTTLHLGPLLVPLIPLVVARKAQFALWATSAAALMGLAVIAILWSTGNLNGPPVSPFNDALTESISLLVAGTAISVVGILGSRRT